MAEIPVGVLAYISEQDLTKVTIPSSASAREVFAAVRMPKEVKSKTILDIGAGGSSATSKLVRLGADAHAVDPAYGSADELIRFLDEANSQLHKVTPNKRFQQERLQGLQQFEQSFQREPARYKTAYATSLPYPNDSFDIAFSRNLIFSYMDVNLNLLMRSAYEAIRVVKPGGTVRLYPFKDMQQNWSMPVNELRMKNNQVLFEVLSSDSAVRSVHEEQFQMDGAISQPRAALIIEKA